MSGTYRGPSDQGSKSQDVKTARKRGRPAKSAVCKQCQEEFPNSQLFRLHTAIDCARNRQEKKRVLDLPKSRKESEVFCENQPSLDAQKLANPNTKTNGVAVPMTESRRTRNINGSKQTMVVKNKTPNVRSSKKKTRSKITWTDSYSDDFTNEERTSDLDSPVVAKKCLNKFLKSKPNLANKNVSTQITELAKGQYENGVLAVKVESSGNDSVIETLGELVQEANNNLNKTGGSDDFHVELKAYSVDIIQLNVSDEKPCNRQADEVNEGNEKLQSISLKIESNIYDRENKTVKEKDLSLSKPKGNDTINHLPTQSKKSPDQNSQNRKMRKRERRRQWEIKREIKMRGAPNPLMDKGMSQERKSYKVDRIKCQDLKLKIEEIDEYGGKEMKTFKSDTSKSIFCNSKNKDDSCDTHPEENHVLYKPEKVRIQSGEASQKSCGVTIVDDWLPDTCGIITKPNLENYAVPYCFSVSSPHSQTSLTETVKRNSGTAFLPSYSQNIVDAPIEENEGTTVLNEAKPHQQIRRNSCLLAHCLPLAASPYKAIPPVTIPYNMSPAASSYNMMPLTSCPYKTIPLASSLYSSMPLASNPYKTIPLTASPYSTMPLEASPYKTISLAASPYKMIPPTASPYITMPLSKQLELTDESDINEVRSPEQKPEALDSYFNVCKFAGENVSAKNIATKTVTRDCSRGSKEDKIVTNNNIFPEKFSIEGNKVSDKDIAKCCETTEKRLDFEQKSPVVFGSPQKKALDDPIMMNSSKDSINEPVMNSDDGDELNISYDDLKFSDEEEAQDGEFSDENEGFQTVASSIKTRPNSSSSPPVTSSMSRDASHLDCQIPRLKKDVNGNGRKLKNDIVGRKSLEEADDYSPITGKEEKASCTPSIEPRNSSSVSRPVAAVDVQGSESDEEDDEIQLDVSYTMFDEEEESSGLEKDNAKKFKPEHDKVSIEVKTEKSEEVKKPRNKIEVAVERERATALDNVISQEGIFGDIGDKRDLNRRKKVEERRRAFENEQLQRRGNYCLSLVKCVPCTTEGCSWVHVLQPDIALHHFYDLYHKSEEEDQTKRLFSFWKFHAMKNVPVGRELLSAVSDMAVKGKMKVDTRGFAQLADYVQSFPDFYTMSLEPGKLVMENLLEAFMSALEDESRRGSRLELEAFFTFAWNRIYLSSLRHGLVMKQNILENICRLAAELRWYCQLCELVFLSSLCPTTWVPVSLAATLLTRLAVPLDNAFGCECSGQEHTREVSLHLAKTISRLMASEWAALARETENFDRKLQILVNAVWSNSVENIGRFIGRIQEIGPQIFLLPTLSPKSQRVKERLERQVSSGKWRDVAKDLVQIDKVLVEDMLELGEELYGVMSQLPPHVAAGGLETLLRELEVLHCTQMHRQLYCQLGLSLLVNLVMGDKFLEGARVVQAIGRTGVDVRTLKPFTVFELANLDDNFSPIAVPLMMLDVYICSGYVDLAVNLLAHWDYLQSYPRPVEPSDQQRKIDIFQRILDKSSTRGGQNALPIRRRIFEILCSDDISQLPLAKRNKMKEFGRNIVVEMLNRNAKGGDLWPVVEGMDRFLHVVTEEVARGVLVRLVQAGMKEEATILYRRTELTATGTYEKQETRADDLKLHLKSYYSLEELQIIIAEFFNELKKTPFIGEKNVYICISETDTPQSGIFLHKRVTTSKKEAVKRVRQILSIMKPPMCVSMSDVPLIPKDQVYKYITESV